MSSKKANIIRAIVAAGRGPDLLALMEGESPYTSLDNPGAPRENPAGRIWSMALHHMRFVAKFGTEVQKATEGDHFYSAYPEDFDKWLSIGAPGVTEDELQAYLSDHPLPTSA
jgi:hypothetical protein